MSPKVPGERAEVYEKTGVCTEFRAWTGRPVPPGVKRPCGNCGRSHDGHRIEFLSTDPPPEQPKGPGDSVPSHYQGKDMQPFDVVRAFGLDYFEGNVLKYLLRWRKKNGVADLKKAAHYLACIIEQEEKEDGF